MNDAWLLPIAVVLLAVCLWLAVRWRRSEGETESLATAHTHLRQELDTLARTMAQTASQLAALGTAAEDLLMAVSADGRVTYANRAAVDRFGPLPPHPPSLIEFTRSYLVDELASDSLRGSPEVRLERVLDVRGRPYRARAARFDGGTVLALTDATEVQRLGRARRDFVANISHELRTPLTSIRVLLDSLFSASAPSPEEASAAMQRIRVEVDTLQQLAQELLDLAQIESGRALVRLVPMPVAPLIGGAVSRLEPQAVQKHLTLQVESPSGLVALADPDQVTRALSNLLHNAIKFTPPGGQVWVRARATGGDVMIEVQDNGPGVRAEDLPRVFERFFQGDRSRAGGGTGLGLAIAKHVVEAHGGRIWAESEGLPGHGATFRFTLPAGDDEGGETA